MEIRCGHLKAQSREKAELCYLMAAPETCSVAKRPVLPFSSSQVPNAPPAYEKLSAQQSPPPYSPWEPAGPPRDAEMIRLTLWITLNMDI